jgi:hypothetical protein
VKPVRVDPEARDEIRDAARWYEARRAGLGTDLISAVDVAIGRASNLGPECRPAPQLPVGLGVRRVLCERFPYVIFFVELPRTGYPAHPPAMVVGGGDLAQRRRGAELLAWSKSCTGS